MISSNCSIKLLDNVYIGMRIRMTSDKNTVPFKNVPLTKLKIEDYTIQGFYLSHKSLPRKIWVDFRQFPLTALTIINGEVQNELTFVENINNHQMELIKTDMLDYIELLDIRSKEGAIKYDTIYTIKAGDIVKSALCNGGEEMIFLGNFFTKGITSKYDYHRGGGYAYKHFMSKASPQRAVFLIKDNQISPEEERELAEIHQQYYDVQQDYRASKEAQAEYNKKKNEFRRACSEKLKSSTLNRFKIVDYPVSSKTIKKIVKVDKTDERFEDETKNMAIILDGVSEYYNRQIYKPTETITKPYRG